MAKESHSKNKTESSQAALRVDKVTIAALAEVLSYILTLIDFGKDFLAEKSSETKEIQELAEKLLPFFVKALASVAEVTIKPCKSQIGSGALPLDLLESSSLVLKPWLVKARQTLNFKASPKVSRTIDSCRWSFA